MPLAIFVIINICSVIIGLFLLFRPKPAIKIQINFYKLINWRITPISWDKEIRNTRIMGLILIGVVFAAIVVNIRF